jgi:hypothetical protein
MVRRSENLGSLIEASSVLPLRDLSAKAFLWPCDKDVTHDVRKSRSGSFGDQTHTTQRSEQL